MGRGGFKRIIATGILCLWFFSLSTIALAMGKAVEVPRMTKEELKAKLGNPDLIILDVRESEAWAKSKWRIQGAVREVPEEGIQPWVHKYSKDKLLILY